MVETNASYFVVRAVFDGKTYREFARVILKSLYTKIVLIFAPWGLILASTIELAMLLLPVFQKGDLQGYFYSRNLNDLIFEVFAFIFLLFTILISLVAFVYSFDVSRVIANPFRTGHKAAFFSSNTDGKHVKYNVILAIDVIKVDKDDEITELSWRDIKGIRETKHYILLIQKGVGINTVVYKNFAKAYIESAVIIAKDGFIKGDLQSFMDFLMSKKKGPLTKKSNQRKSEFYVWRCPTVREAISQMRNNRKKAVNSGIL